MRKHINWVSRKTVDIITANKSNYATNCTSVLFENEGTVTAWLKIDGTERRFRPGASIVFTNDPDVLEDTLIESITFEEIAGEKYIVVTKEFVTDAEEER